MFSIVIGVLFTVYVHLSKFIDCILKIYAFHCVYILLRDEREM